jgi:hypothetical protein
LRHVLLTTALVLALAAPAGAAEPIMPLAEVQKGMRCTGLSVFEGTAIEPFDVEVVDVIAGDDAAAAPRILIRVSGERIERTGLGPGFSGSPIICRDREGRDAYAGAISEGIGEYGGLLGLATPMELVVGQPVEPPVGARPAPALRRRARPLAGPLTVSGVSPRVGALLTRLARRQGRELIAATAAPRAVSFPVQELRPGAAMSAGYSSGAVNIGGVGTVAYADGDRVWAFGHPLEAAGRRSLFLQDAYVYTIVNNPVGVEGVSTYKLAAPGHNLGIVSGDGLSAVAGRVGVPPNHFPIRVIATDGDTGRFRDLRVDVADENHLGQPTGISALALVGAATVGQAAVTVLGEIPARQSGEMCASFRVTGYVPPLKFCNRYVMRSGAFADDLGLGPGGPMVSDISEAIAIIDSFDFGTIDMDTVEVNMTLRRGLRQAYMLRAKGPRTVRRGRTVRVRVQTQVVRGARSWQTMRVKVPLGMPRGRRLLTLTGPDTDDGGVLEIDLSELLFGEGEEDLAGPRTLSKLRKEVTAIGRYDGVEASFEPRRQDDLGDEDPNGAEGIARRPRKVFRDPDLRLSGTVRVPVVVR